MAKVNFSVAKTLSTYNGLSSKDTNTLYFVLDAKKIFKGDVDVTSAVEVVTSFDGTAGTGNINVADAVAGKFYVNATTFEMRIKNGSAWTILSPGYLTTGGEWAQADNDAKLGTIGVIKTIIGQALADIAPAVSYDNTTGTLTVGDTTARLTGIINGIEYSSEQLQLTVKSISASGGPTTQTISLPKDNFVRSGRYEANYELPGGGTGPAIVLTVNGGEETEDTEVVIPAASLVEVYTGGSTQNITVNVSEDNQITASAIIDSVAGNALVSGENGLSVSIIPTSVADGHIAVADGTGKLKDGGVTVITSGEMGTSASQVPVASLISAAITVAVESAQGTLEASISSLTDRVTDLETFEAALVGKYLTSSVADNFVGFLDANGNIKDSGKKAGGATLAGTPDSNTLATEAAVAAAISWQELQ